MKVLKVRRAGGGWSYAHAFEVDRAVCGYAPEYFAETKKGLEPACSSCQKQQPDLFVVEKKFQPLIGKRK